MSSPEVDVDSVEQSQEGETPLYGIDNDFFTPGGELEEHCSQEKEMDEGPDVERIVGRGYVGRFAGVIDVIWSCYRVDV